MSNQGFSQHSTESPTNEMRNRKSATSYGTPPVMSGAFPEGPERERSPSSTIFGSPVAGPPSAEPSSPAPSWGMNSRLRNIIIKADPAMTTSFDPSDEELYDLWAPAR